MEDAKEYVNWFDAENRVRVRHRLSGGTITEFVVNFETLVEDRWVVVVRWDCAHGYLHRHQMFADGTWTKEKINAPYTMSKCMVETLAYFKESWWRLREKYLEVRK